MAKKTFVKLSRCLLKNVVFQNEKLLKVWIWCLLKANYCDHVQLIGAQNVSLKPGQFVFGRKQAALELGFSESFVFRSMKRLESLQKVNIKPNNKFSVITVLNWELYQSIGGKDEQQNEQQMNNRRTTDEQQMNTNKNIKEIKEVEEVNAITVYQNEIGLITGVIAEKVGDVVDQYGEKWVCEAIKIAAVRNKRSFAYVDGILKGWWSDGFKPEDQPWNKKKAEDKNHGFKKMILG